MDLVGDLNSLSELKEMIIAEKPMGDLFIHAPAHPWGKESNVAQALAEVLSDSFCKLLFEEDAEKRSEIWNEVKGITETYSLCDDEEDPYYSGLTCCIADAVKRAVSSAAPEKVSGLLDEFCNRHDLFEDDVYYDVLAELRIDDAFYDDVLRAKDNEPERSESEELPVLAAAAYISSRVHSATMPKIELLLYLSQAESLRKKGKPLFEEDFIASPFGPILPTLHKIYKRSSDVSAAPFFSESNINFPLSEEEKEIMESVLWQYSELKVTELMGFAREEWAGIRKNPGENAVIPKEKIRISKSAAASDKKGK